AIASEGSEGSKGALFSRTGKNVFHVGRPKGGLHGLQKGGHRREGNPRDSRAHAGQSRGSWVALTITRCAGTGSEDGADHMSSPSASAGPQRSVTRRGAKNAIPPSHSSTARLRPASHAVMLE